MIGQNVMMELVEGDKVQIYLNTHSGITDHKNSHYTQFIGVLMRPSVETLGAAMRRLGNAELEEDVSMADDFSVRSARVPNGDVNGGRSKRSKSRLLSPEPARGGGGNSSTQQTADRRSVERLLSPPPLQTNNHALQNGGGSGHSEVIPEEQEEDLIALADASKPASAANKVPEAAAPAEDKPQQSYLALTKLGMGGKKKQDDTEVEASGAGKKAISPKDSKKAQNGPKEKKGKSMAEMASSTLKGFAKM